MQFFALITLALSAVTSAELSKLPLYLEQYCLQDFRVANTSLLPAQVVRRQVPVSEAAMTDASGNIVSYNAAGVYKAATSQGL